MTEHELSRDLAVLEERMKTMQAEYKTDIARLAEDSAKRDAGHKADIAQFAKDADKRETRLLLTLAGLIGVATAILSAVIAVAD